MGALQYHEIPLTNDSQIETLFQKHYKMLYFLGHYGLQNNLQTEYLMLQVLYDTYVHTEELEGAREEQIRSNLILRMLNKISQVITNRRKISEQEIRQRDTLLKLLETSLGLSNVTIRLYQALPPYDRMIYSLYYLEDYESQEISKMLHTSPYRIRNRLDEITAIIEKLALHSST